ncbi:hypothetical protein SEA_CONFIDENCE_72 [Gordonia phage Confidence]|nr:hypothetical protein SEA_CONFIDENCE_72 [Gordonia phage Confidence]
MTDIVDEIDALIEGQLDAGEPIGGYDYDDPDFPKCGHCGRDWHGLAITERIEEMRWRGELDDDYRYSEDDSRVICPGSEFIGPLLAAPVEHETSPWTLPEDPIDAATWLTAVPSWTVAVGEPARWWRLDAALYRHRNLRFEFFEDIRGGRRGLVVRIDSGIDEYQGVLTLEATSDPEHLYACTNYMIDILVSLDVHARRPDDLGGRIVWHEIDGPGGDYSRSRAMIATSSIDRWFDDRGLWFLAPREARAAWWSILDLGQRLSSFPVRWVLGAR